MEIDSYSSSCKKPLLWQMYSPGSSFDFDFENTIERVNGFDEFQEVLNGNESSSKSKTRSSSISQYRISVNFCPTDDKELAIGKLSIRDVFSTEDAESSVNEAKPSITSQLPDILPNALNLRFDSTYVSSPCFSADCFDEKINH